MPPRNDAIPGYVCLGKKCLNVYVIGEKYAAWNLMTIISGHRQNMLFLKFCTIMQKITRPLIEQDQMKVGI